MTVPSDKLIAQARAYESEPLGEVWKVIVALADALEAHVRVAEAAREALNGLMPYVGEQNHPAVDAARTALAALDRQHDGFCVLPADHVGECSANRLAALDREEQRP